MLKLLTDSGGSELIRCDNYYIRELASGLDEVIFTISVWDPVYPLLVEEARIQDRDQQIYLIKQIDGGEKTAKIIAQIDLDAWKSQIYIGYNNGIATVANTVSGILPAGWTLTDDSGVTIRRQVNGALTAYEICAQCEKTFGVWFRWNNATKTVRIVSKVMGSPSGAFATRDLNLKKINYKGKSNGLITRLYCYGQDDMTFASINDGKAYVDNFTYTDKILPGFWKDERYTVKQNLLEDGIARLAELAVPRRSYECAVVDLQAVDPAKYAFLDFSLFTVATLIDDIKNFAVNYQIVERHIYPYYPEKNDVIFDTSPEKITGLVDETIEILNTKISAEAAKIEVDRATGVLQTGKSGYVVIGRNTDGYANEIYFLDRPSLEDAVHVLRINRAGIGFSSTGYEGPYYQSWTMDGHFALGGVNNAFGDFQILDGSGNPLGEWDKDGLKFYDSGQHILMLLNHSGLFLRDTNANTVAQMTADGLNIYKGTISGVTINIARGNEIGLYCDGTRFQFGDFEVNDDYGRQILESTDEKTGMGGEPDSDGGLYLWAGYNSGNDYRLAVNDAGLYTMYDGTAYNVGQTLAYILENCCGGGCVSDGCDCEGNSPGCPGDGCLCYGSADEIGDGCCMCDAVTDSGGGTCSCDTGESCPSCDSGESCTCNTGESCSCDTAQCGPGDGL